MTWTWQVVRQRSRKESSWIIGSSGIGEAGDGTHLSERKVTDIGTT